MRQTRLLENLSLLQDMVEDNEVVSDDKQLVDR